MKYNCLTVILRISNVFVEFFLRNARFHNKSDNSMSEEQTFVWKLSITCVINRTSDWSQTFVYKNVIEK